MTPWHYHYYGVMEVAVDLVIFSCFLALATKTVLIGTKYAKHTGISSTDKQIVY